MSDASATAGRCPRAVVGFLVVLAVVLAVDLGTKYAAFAYVGDRPVTLVRDWEAVEAWWQSGDHENRMVVVYDDPQGELASIPAVPVAPKLLRLKLTTNTGAVFGLGAGQRVVFVSVGLVAAIVIGFLFWHSPASARFQHLALALILAGAFGNLYDRVMYSAVRDMFHMLPGVHLPFGLRWPGQGEAPGASEVWPWVFNVADVSLLIGVAGVLITSWRAGETGTAKADADDQSDSVPASS